MGIWGEGFDNEMAGSDVPPIGLLLAIKDMHKQELCPGYSERYVISDVPGPIDEPWANDTYEQVPCPDQANGPHRHCYQCKQSVPFGPESVALWHATDDPENLDVGTRWEAQVLVEVICAPCSCGGSPAAGYGLRLDDAGEWEAACWYS